MKNIWICNKWKMQVTENSLQDVIEIGGRRKVPHEKRIQHLSENAYCLYRALKIIGKVESVLDLCAGIGLWATVLRQEIDPPKMTLVDLDKACCKHLYKRFSKVIVINCDYNEISWFGQNLVCMDVTISTAMRVFDCNATIPLIRVLEDNPKWVLISDCAAGKLHLNATHYKKVLDEIPTDYFHYINLYSRKLRKVVGKSIHTAFLSGGGDRPHSCYFLIRSEKVKKTHIQRINDVPSTTFGYKETRLL